MIELLLLLHGIAFATVGATGYAIFGPLTVRHLADRGRAHEMAGSSLSWTGMRWLLAARYRGHDDANLQRLALPARIMLLLVLSGLALLLLRYALSG
jgi:hypothetical protein